MSTAKKASAADHVSGVLSGDRAKLARAITLIESRNADHRKLAEQVLAKLTPHAGKSMRIGISGLPGAGKSTFIDALGTMLTGQGHKVAVLAVDPTSSRSGGSILGDKTRMARLSQDPAAFIRPSPTGGTLGGVARATREAIVLCEAADFDIVLVETVGVGQSEIAVSEMVDFFLVLMLAGGGDELQGIKRGVLEIADMIAVTKADGDNIKRADAAADEYKHALRIVTPHGAAWSAPVVTVSSLENRGIAELWKKILSYRQAMQASGVWNEKRRGQQIRWMWALVEDRLMSALKADPKAKALVKEVERELAKGETTPSLAATRVLKSFGI